MKSFFLLITILFLSELCFSQTLSGFIYDDSDNTIPYATIFIKELNMGTTSNSQGEYKLNLLKGTYTIQYRSIGFEQVILTVSIDTINVEQNIVLNSQSYQLHEIRVYKDNVDPAYPIMRRAVSMAPYYQSQVKKYKADVYLKGTAKIIKMPKSIQRHMKVEINGNIIGYGDVFVGESLSEIDFDAPDIYHQKIISSNMTMLDDKNTSFDMGLVTESPYQPIIGDDIISPLAPQSFKHYNFKYEGFYDEGDYLINKIKIIPKRKSKQLFSGYVYIIDGLWCLRGLDLNLDKGFGNMHIDIQLAQVEKDILLPISHAIKIDAKMMGVSGLATYASSVKYQSFIKNSELKLPVLLQDYYDDVKVQEEIADLSKSKRIQKIEALMAKEELSKSDAIRIARLMKKEADEKEQEEKPDFEIIETYHVEKLDSTIQRSDDYWELMRPNPLSVEEQESYRKTDSLMTVYATQADSIVPEKKKVLSKIVGKKYFNLKNDSIRLTISSLIAPHLLSFNAVEGWKYRQEFNYQQSLKNNNQLNYDGWLGYSFGTNKIQWSLHGKYQFAPMHHGKVQYSSGDVILDYMHNNGVSSLVNSVSSLFFKQNYARYYQQRYFTFSSEIEFINGLLLSGEFDFFNRNHLQNNTNFSFFNRDENYYANEIEDMDGDYLNLENHISAIANLRLAYTPQNYYRVVNGKKINVGSDWPTFSIAINKGFKGIYNSSSNWTKMELGIQQEIELGVANELSYAINASGFLNNNTVAFADFLQVNVSSVPVEIRSSQFAFKLLPYYVHNTNEQMLTIGVHYNTPNLFLKYLPWISKRNWKENLHLNYLTTPDFKNYVEFGYSLSELLFNSEVGVYCSFENENYRQTGVRTVIRF